MNGYIFDNDTKTFTLKTNPTVGKTWLAQVVGVSHEKGTFPIIREFLSGKRIPSDTYYSWEYVLPNAIYEANIIPDGYSPTRILFAVTDDGLDMLLGPGYHSKEAFQLLESYFALPF